MLTNSRQPGRHDLKCVAVSFMDILAQEKSIDRKVGDSVLDHTVLGRPALGKYGCAHQPSKWEEHMVSWKTGGKDCGAAHIHGERRAVSGGLVWRSIWSRSCCRANG